MPHPVTENDLGRLKFATFPDGDQNWVHETSYCGAEFRWIATQDKFESRLYRLPIWNLPGNPADDCLFLFIHNVNDLAIINIEIHGSSPN